MTLRLGELDKDADPDPGYLVREALKRWTDMNRDEATFRNAVVEYNGQRTEAWRLITRNAETL